MVLIAWRAGTHTHTHTHKHTDVFTKTISRNQARAWFKKSQRYYHEEHLYVFVCAGTALTSAQWPCLHFHCAFWFPHQRAHAHVALCGLCFRTGRTRRSEYQQHYTQVALTTARSPHPYVIMCVAPASETKQLTAEN